MARHLNTEPGRHRRAGRHHLPVSAVADHTAVHRDLRWLARQSGRVGRNWYEQATARLKSVVGYRVRRQEARDRELREVDAWLKQIRAS